jgi:hypothetical protein
MLGPRACLGRRRTWRWPRAPSCRTTYSCSQSCTSAALSSSPRVRPNPTLAHPARASPLPCSPPDLAHDHNTTSHLDKIQLPSARSPFVLPSPPLVFARRGQGAGGLPRRAASLLRGAWRGTAARPQKVEQTGWPRPSRRQGSRAAARPQVPATRSGSYPTPRLPFAARRRSSSSSVTWPTHSSSTCTSRRSRCPRTSSLGSPLPPSRRRCHPETSPMGPVQPLYVLG